MASARITSIRKGVIAVVSSSDGELDQSAILSSIRRNDDSYGNDSDWGCDFVFMVNSTSSSSSYVYTSYIDFGIDSYNTYALEQDYQPNVDSTGGIRSQDTYKCLSSHIGEEDAGYKFQGFVLYFVDDTTHAITSSNNNYVFFLHKAELEPIYWGQWAEETIFPYYEVCISPVYTYTAPATGHLELRYASPIVINRSPDDTTTHIIKSENGYSENVFLINQPGFLYYLEEDDDGIYSSYDEQEQETVSGGKELVKVVKVPSNQYLASQDYGVVVTGGGATGILQKGSNPITIEDSWKEELDSAGAGIKFIVDLLGRELLNTFTRLNDTKAYKFLGICVYYTTSDFETGYTHKGNSDRCYFISKNNFDTLGQAEFTILCRGTSTDDVLTATEGVLHLAPVFEALREVYLTEPIIVKNFPAFTNITDIGSFGKDTSIPIDSSGNIEFGYTDGIQNANIFISNRGNFSGLCNHSDYFNPTVSVDAGFVELFGSWSGHVSDAWKQNMTSNGNFVSQTYLGWNQISYDKDSQRTFSIHSNDTYINTAETDNNSLYLYIHGTCSDSNIVPPSYSEGMTVQDYQAKCNGCEMIGFIVYFKEGAELDDIEKWRDPSDGSSYASYFAPVLWEGGSFSAKIKIDLYGENELNDLPFENYLAISPVYLKTDTKTIVLGCVQDTAGNDISDYVDTYTVSVTVGDTTTQYSQGDSIEVSEGDIITITLASSTDNENYTYSETFTIGGTTYNDGTSIGYDALENGDEFHPLFTYIPSKTVVISDALDENGNVLSDLTTNDKYKFSDNNGNEYGYNDSVNVHYDETIVFTCNFTESGVIFDSSTTTYSEYKLTGIEVTDGNNKTIINSSNSSISISYKNFGDINNLYIHPIYTYDEKESTKYKINNDTCRAIQLSADEGCYVNGNLSTPLEVAEWANVDVAIYPKSTLKISGIKNIEYWHSFGVDGINIGDGGEVSIYDCIEDIDDIDYNIDLYMKVAKQDLDVYHMSFLKGNLSFNTSSEGNVYVHSWSDKGSAENDEPINNLIKDLGGGKKSLILRGELPIDYNFYSYSRNKTIKSISATTTHVIDEDNNVCPDNNQLINISLIPNTINSLYYLDKGSHFMDMYGETNPFIVIDNDNDHRWPGEDWKYGGNGRYYFIVDLSNFNTGDTTAFDYESYACGPLIGYINEREDDNTNAVILKEDDFFIGIIEPGSSSVTVYGYDTVDSEQYLMTHNENNIYNGPYVINITDDNILGSIREINYLGEDQIMPNDYCQYQTGNQYVMFRLRNPYSGKVLNYDDSCSYGVLTNVETAEEALGGSYSNSTHEQTGFLTLWEQRSLFNALNGKPTYVNEVNEWAKMDESTIESLTNKATPNSTTVTTDSGDVDSNNYIDTESYWYKYVYQKFGDDENLRDSTYFIINTKTRRKAGRALVDNIDDWFDWYKREEQPGVITNGNNDLPGGTPLCFAGPLLNNEYGCCIDSDAVRSSMMLGPGESITIPIIVLYKTYEENGRDTASYSLGFDIRNSLYSDPLYYEVKFAAKYHSSVTDAVSSQKASIQESTKYNVTVR